MAGGRRKRGHGGKSKGKKRRKLTHTIEIGVVQVGDKYFEQIDLTKGEGDAPGDGCVFSLSEEYMKLMA